MAVEEKFRSIADGLSAISRTTLMMVKSGRIPYIIVIEDSAGKRMNIGGESFGVSLGSQEFDLWKSAVHELNSTDLLERTGEGVYHMTDLGYAVAGWLNLNLPH